MSNLTHPPDSMVDHIAMQFEQGAFEEMDRNVIRKMSDHDLSMCQVKYSHDSPQGFLAQHEWKRRLEVEEAQSNQLGTCVRILAFLVSFALIWALIKMG